MSIAGHRNRDKYDRRVARIVEEAEKRVPSPHQEAAEHGIIAPCRKPLPCNTEHVTPRER
jgi:hypothetical protein